MKIIYIIAVIIGLVVLSRLSRKRETDLNWQTLQNIQSVLTDHEEIIAGQRWSIKDADMLAFDYVTAQEPPGPVTFEYVCRTKNGAWFLLEVGLSKGRVVRASLNPCGEATAKSRLQRHKEVYVRYFGQLLDA